MLKVVEEKCAFENANGMLERIIMFSKGLTKHIRHLCIRSMLGSRSINTKNMKIRSNWNTAE